MTLRAPTTSTLMLLRKLRIKCLPQTPVALQGFPLTTNKRKQPGLPALRAGRSQARRALDPRGAGIFRFLAVILVALACGCTTPYVHEGPSSDDSLGYNERKFSDDIYHVWASVNEYHDVSYTYTLRRCAELALEHKYRYFVLMTKDNRQSVFREVDDEFLRRVFHGQVVRFLPNQDVPDAQDAVAVVLKTDAVARRRLSRKARQNMIELSRQKSN